MELGELIAMLESLREEVGDQTEVRIAVSHHYPIRHTVENVCWLLEEGEFADDEDADKYDPDGKKFVWIAAGDYIAHPESPYASRQAWSE